MSLHLPVSFHPGVRFLISNGMGGSEVVAKLVMAIESGQIDSGFGIGRGRSINGWEEMVDSNTLMYNCNFGVNVEEWSGEIIERVICVDPPLSKRICSTGQ